MRRNENIVIAVFEQGPPLLSDCPLSDHHQILRGLGETLEVWVIPLLFPSLGGFKNLSTLQPLSAPLQRLTPPLWVGLKLWQVPLLKLPKLKPWPE